MKKVDLALLPELLELTEKIQGSLDIETKNLDTYFEVLGFKEFSSISGYTVNEFHEIYQEFMRVVQEYYYAFQGDNDTRYSPLIARVGLYGGLNFILRIEREKTYPNILIEGTAINILNGDYFVAGKRGKIDFLPCEEVIKRLIYLYKDNQIEFDSVRRGTGEYIPIEPSLLDVFKSIHY